jgi:hypothetical protein
MGKCYCDYCDVFLTHDSASVRKQHNDGNRHRQNVSEYYRQYIARSTQERIDEVVYDFERRVAVGLVLPTYGVSNINGRPAAAEAREQTPAQGEKAPEEGKGEEKPTVSGSDGIDKNENSRNSSQSEEDAARSSDDANLATLDSPSRGVSAKQLSKPAVPFPVEQVVDTGDALFSHKDATSSPNPDELASVDAELAHPEGETMLNGQTQGPTLVSEPAGADEGSDMDLDDD